MAAVEKNVRGKLKKELEPFPFFLEEK